MRRWLVLAWILCCCSTYGGGSCCADVSFCTGVAIPGCVCAPQRCGMVEAP